MSESGRERAIKDLYPDLSILYGSSSMACQEIAGFLGIEPGFVETHAKAVFGG